MSGRQRLDVALEARGLLPSRARARDAVLRGTVTVNGSLATKPGLLVAEADAIALDDPAAGYVSRAALKLIAGLDAGRIDAAGKVCLDLGMSTGGFTQVLLERGAKRVYGIEVGHRQVHPDIAGDPRVVAMEGVSARDVSRALVPEPVDLLVCDLSFVSVTKVLAAPLALCAARADAVILIKPQFEVGREHVGKGGIVSDPAAIQRAAADVVAFMTQRGWRHRVSIPSPIAGGDGNKEIVAVFQRLNGL
jgi:23S rRNA (cytidine1920-2'-O)/16S rRNA (cytidine1409-2'-O)-methyltransferase